VTRKHRRLVLLLACGAGVASASALALTAFQSSLVYFVSPSQILAQGEPPDRTVRLGGLVEAGSVQHLTVNGQPETLFQITDNKAAVKVSYVGMLPSLFREGQGIVAIGTVRTDGEFQASEVLAKHDANYMPKDVVEALKASGRWNPADGEAPPASTWDTMSIKHTGG
jgi:cytochrome c-type biogenesis protein CcmE